MLQCIRDFRVYEYRLNVSGVPQDRAGRIRWQRLHQRIKIVPYQTTKFLNLKCAT